MVGDDARFGRSVWSAADCARPVQEPRVRTSWSLSFIPGLFPSREAVTWPGCVGLLEVITDQLAVLGQELVEVLVDVPFADRFRGQVEVLDLLKPARAAESRVLVAVLTGGVRCRPSSVPGAIARGAIARVPAGSWVDEDGGGVAGGPGSDGGRLEDTSGSNGPRVSSGTGALSSPDRSYQ